MLKRLILILALSTLAPAQELLTPPKPLLSVTVFVCKPYRDTEECRKKLGDWQRFKDESELNEAIIDDFRAASAHKVDPKTRKRILELAKKIAQNNYQ